jgi:hypothetical protein
MTPGRSNLTSKIHPAQRYEVRLQTLKYEYLGAIEDYDVLWLPGVARILLKCSSRVGDTWRILMPTRELLAWERRYLPNRTEPTAEQIDLAAAMALCFAQAGRESLVRPDTNKETRDAAV